MKTPPHWVRIHLSTAFVLSLVAAALLYLNLDNPRLLKTSIVGVDERQVPHCIERTIHIDAVYRLRGWPLYASPDCKTSVIVKDFDSVRPLVFDDDGNLIEPIDAKVAVIKEFPPIDFNKGPLYGFWEWWVVFVNLAVNLSALIFVAFILEFRLRWSG